VIGTDPNVRESDEKLRLSPITKISPAGTGKWIRDSRYLWQRVARELGSDQDALTKTFPRAGR